jgi:hypothetical protein
MAARASRLNIALRMLGLGIVLGWAAVFLIPLGVRMGIPERAANRLPFLGFFLGLGLGLASALSRTVKGVLSYAVLVPICGGVFWFFGVLLGGLLVGVGLSPDAADYVPIVGFCLGVGVALLPGLVVGSEAIGAYLSRSTKSHRNGDNR